MKAYTDYFSRNLEDRNFDEQEMAMALDGLPSVTQKFAQLKIVCILISGLNEVQIGTAWENHPETEGGKGCESFFADVEAELD